MISITKEELAICGFFFVWRICPAICGLIKVSFYAELVKKMLKFYIFCFIMV
ncbi:glycine dehydrogenase [Bacillus wiedmannii]|nr:glycine dehydrogenase [Bacillus wiedmannii]PEM29877.1 glycine dehydrogenase [Bacillus wiedmannii]PEM91369.1 glycine dehydrogenase [Bacillus wiedmannii]PEO87352.1 glycine dehydrogenase [Bacillus wiedmannii]